MPSSPTRYFEQLPVTEVGRQTGSAFESNRRGGAIDASWLVGFLRRRRLTILTSLALTLAAVTVVSLVLPPKFESDLTVLVEVRAANEEVQALDALALLGRGRHIETEMELIRSRRVLGPVIEDLALTVFRRPPGDTSGVHGIGDGEGEARLTVVTGPALEEGRHVLVAGSPSWILDRHGDRLTLSSMDDGVERRVASGTGRVLEISVPAASAEAIADHSAWQSGELARLAGRIDVGRVQRDADLIRVTCEAATAEGARQLCDSIQRAYLSLRMSMQRGEATSMREFLADQLERAAERLEAAEDSLEAYGTRHGVVALDDQASSEVRALTDLRARRDVLEAERAALADVLEDVRSGGSSRYRELATFPSFVDNEAVTQMVASLVELENERSVLAVRRTEANPDLAALDERIRSIGDQLLAMGTRYESSLAAQVASLDATLRNMRGRLSTIPQRQVDHARLSRETKQAEDVYAMLESRMSEARIAESVNLPNVRVVDEASLPASRTSPKLGLNLLLGAIGGLSLGLGLALVRERLDDGIRGRAEVERETGLSVLTMVPHVSRPGPVLMLEAADGAGNGGIGTVRSRRARPLDEETTRLLALEAYRSLAMELRLAQGDENGRKGFRTLAVTSANRAEGKTLTACNLAIVYASKGYRTLLADADLRASGVARFFGLENGDPGLSDLLTDRGRVVASVVQRIGLAGGEKLSVLSAGRRTTDGARLLESDRFRLVFAEMVEAYDLVVFDTPPLNLITDAAAVATLVEGVLVVVRSGVTEKEHLDYTLQRLRRVNSSVLGVVLNDAHVSESYGTSYDPHPPESIWPTESTT